MVPGIFATFCRALELLAVQNILMCKMRVQKLCPRTRIKVERVYRSTGSVVSRGESPPWGMPPKSSPGALMPRNSRRWAGGRAASVALPPPPARASSVPRGLAAAAAHARVRRAARARRVSRNAPGGRDSARLAPRPRDAAGPDFLGFGRGRMLASEPGAAADRRVFLARGRAPRHN